MTKVQIGDVFSRWTVLHIEFSSPGTSHKRTMCVCQCSCGTIRSVLPKDLLSGSSKGCFDCYIKRVKYKFTDEDKKEAHNAHTRRYYQKNKDRILTRTKQYAKDNPHIARKAVLEYREKNREVINLRIAMYRKANKEYCLQLDRISKKKRLYGEFWEVALLTNQLSKEIRDVL